MSMRNTAIAAALFLALGCESRQEERAEIRGEMAEERAEERGAGLFEQERAEERAEEPLEEQQEQEGSLAERQGTQPDCFANPNDPACLEQQGTTGTEGTTGAQGTTGATAGSQQGQLAQDQPSGAQEQPSGEMQPTTSTGDQIVEHTSQGELSNVLSRLQRELRDNDFEVITTIRYDQQARERALQQQQQQLEQQQQAALGAQEETGAQGQQGQEQQAALGAQEEQTGSQQQREQQQAMQEHERHQQQAMQEQQAQQQQGQQQLEQGLAQGELAQGQSEIGDVRVIVYRRMASEAELLKNQGIAALLEAPRQIAVFERGENNVVIAYAQPSEQMAMAGEEPVGQLLDRISRDITEQQQQTASAQQQQEQEPIASAEQMNQQELEEGMIEGENEPFARGEGMTEREGSLDDPYETGSDVVPEAGI